MFLFREGEPLLRSVYSPREGRLLQHKVTVSSQPGEQSKEHKDLFRPFKWIRFLTALLSLLLTTQPSCCWTLQGTRWYTGAVLYRTMTGTELYSPDPGSANGSHGVWAGPGRHTYLHILTVHLEDECEAGKPWQTWDNLGTYWEVLIFSVLLKLTYC